MAHLKTVHAQSVHIYETNSLQKTHTYTAKTFVEQ